MQKGRSLQYAAAGVQDAPGMRMRVRSHVRLPDSEVGASDEQARQPFHAGHVMAKPQESVTVPLNAALLFLCALFVAVGAMALVKTSRRAELSKNITAIEEGIQQTRRDNIELAVEVAEARDLKRIDDLATHNLNMCSQKSVTAEWVTAPDTRPFEQKTTLQAESSPNSVPDGKLSGSR